MQPQGKATCCGCTAAIHKAIIAVSLLVGVILLAVAISHGPCNGCPDGSKCCTDSGSDSSFYCCSTQFDGECREPCEKRDSGNFISLVVIGSILTLTGLIWLCGLCCCCKPKVRYGNVGYVAAPAGQGAYAPPPAGQQGYPQQGYPQQQQQQQQYGQGTYVQPAAQH